MTRPILLIEDNEHNRYLASYLLESAGYRVVEAQDGPRGLALAAQIDPSLILLDIQLPGLDGYAVARALGANPALASIPILAVTSHATPDHREAASLAGCRETIGKPIDPDTFVATVRRHLSGGDTGAGA